jgi:threonine dehydrogenase-like Zn-dependent dehydrogenase
MRAAALDYQQRRLVSKSPREPRLERDFQVLFRVREVGVCGTDRQLANFCFGHPPKGDEFLILGHEALGEVVEVGRAVKNFKVGDLVVPTVRRACEPPCASCARGRRDLCLTGGYRERGIFGLHGYFTEYAVDDAQDLVLVPPELADCGVLLEPLSVVEKAVETALRIHEPGAENAIVLGAGTIGILTALVLRLRGLSVGIRSLEPVDHPRARLVRDAGIEYLPATDRRVADIVIEATGSPEAALTGMRLLAPLGVCVVLGAPNTQGEIPFLDMIVRNQTVLGCVNAAPQSFAQAVHDLAQFDHETLRRIIRRVAFDQFQQSILGPEPDTPKLVHVISDE